MWSKISSALKQREGNDSEQDHPDPQSTPRNPQPDPFRANATTYYSHQAPPTPPPGHSRTASREEDIIWSLRTQLALQQELCAQFEIDLGARDELVEALTIRLEASEKENDKRKNVVRSWKKKTAELEKICRHLEGEVDNGRRESMERSIMDEASGEALRQLHRQISQLEREKNDIEAERNALAESMDNAAVEITTLRERFGNADEDEETVHQFHRISELEQEKNDLEGERNSLARAVEKADAEITGLREELSTTDEASAEALRQLHSQISQLEQEKSDLQAERDALVQTREKANAEAIKLREELDTVGGTNSEEIRRLHGRISQLEREKSDIDMAHSSLVQAKGKVDAEVIRLQEELGASNESNREALYRLHEQISLLEREKSEVETERHRLAQATRKTEADVFRLQEELSVTSEASRQAQQRLHEQVSQLERTKIATETERDDFGSEIARLRAHIQQVQKGSAVMEVTIVQLNKQLEQDKEDIDGLNIALESKQQELELVKRKHGVRSTVSSTSSRPSTAGKPVGGAAPPSTASRTSSVGTRTSSPVLPRVPSTLGRAANTRPPVSSALRRASSSSVESKAKLPSRRLSITSSPSEADEKENAATPVPLKHPRRTMVQA